LNQHNGDDAPQNHNTQILNFYIYSKTLTYKKIYTTCC